MELEESVIESTFAFSRFASLMLVLAIVFIVISLIQYKIKKKRTKGRLLFDNHVVVYVQIRDVWVYELSPIATLLADSKGKISNQ